MIKDNIKILFTDFSKNMQDIIEDIVDLFFKTIYYRISYEEVEAESKETETNYLKMYLYYFKELIIILTKKQNVLYWFSLAVSIMIYFY